MGFARFGVVGALLACGALLGCSDAANPPPIGDGDGGGVIQDDSGSIVPCSVPEPTCPCADAGTQVSCGTIYRISGSHVDCSPGYLTCQDDNTWSACLGPSVYTGDL